MNLNRQFTTLQAHFFNRFFDRDGHTDCDDERDSLVHKLAVLATPGLMLSFWMLISGRALSSGGPELRYVFVTASAVVTGLVMAYKWDALLPDRYDYRILTPLPATPGKVFLARIAALVKFVSLYVVAVNAFPMLLVPPAITLASRTVGAEVLPQAFLAHAAGTLGGSIFVALSFTAVHGVLVNLLTVDAFRRVSPRVQAGATALMVAIFMMTPLLSGSIGPIASNGSRLFDFFPVAWFAGLYETLSPIGSSAEAWSRWAWIGITGIGVAALVTLSTYLLGYTRHSRRLVESIEAPESAPGRIETLWTRALNATILRTAGERAAFHFIGKVSARSAVHRLMAAAYTGAGVAIAGTSLFEFVEDMPSAFPFLLSESGLIEAPVILSFLIVTGMRITFGLPYEWKARWVFDFSRAHSAEFMRATRKWVFTARVIPMYIALAVFEFALFDFRTALGHVLFDAAVTWLLIEVCFFDFRTIPYTSFRRSKRLELALLALVYIFAFSFFVDGAVALQERVIASGPRLVAFLTVVVLAGRALATYARTNPKATLVDIRLDTDIQELRLS
jgi:hypothetical protein